MQMPDPDLCQRIGSLGKPEFVIRVDWRVTGNHVSMWLEHPPGSKWPGPQCGLERPWRDHAADGTWRHGDTCRFPTCLQARIPRLACVISSRLKSIRRVTTRLPTHLKNILTYGGGGVTKTVAPGRNCRIRSIKRRAYGYRNQEPLHIAIYFFCGGLCMYPR
jgi:hypothetical protein